MTERLWSVGVDLGGSRLRVAGVDRSGKIVFRAAAPAVAPERLKSRLQSILAHRGKAAYLTVGSKGVWSAPQREALARRLTGLARSTRVLPDVELAHYAAFGGGPGVLLIAGTGSIALAKDARGRRARAGGLGPLLGDEGSAFWIGRQWLKQDEARALRLAHRPDCVAAVARESLQVLALAKRSAKARRLIAEAHHALSLLAERAASRLQLTRPTPLALHGGLFRLAAFRAGLERQLLSRKRWQLARARMPAELAAARIPIVI